MPQTIGKVWGQLDYPETSQLLFPRGTDSVFANRFKEFPYEGLLMPADVEQY